MQGTSRYQKTERITSIPQVFHTWKSLLFQRSSSLLKGWDGGPQVRRQSHTENEEPISFSSPSNFTLGQHKLGSSFTLLINVNWGLNKTLRLTPSDHARSNPSRGPPVAAQHVEAAARWDVRETWHRGAAGPAFPHRPRTPNPFFPPVSKHDLLPSSKAL